jgi:hypothetical protein
MTPFVIFDDGSDDDEVLLWEWAKAEKEAIDLVDLSFDLGRLHSMSVPWS